MDGPAVMRHPKYNVFSWFTKLNLYVCIVEYIADKSMIYAFYVQGFMFDYVFIPSTSEVHVKFIESRSYDNLYWDLTVNY